ncbi:hypothetical protein [Pseudomonas trivialis]|uniref:SH3 domain-containing protein n=1 Tax=Pseudomonas trivialis TaxID=200450 RepID=A0A0R2ZKC4_9PSED|nr:hypothetical protein [Pseudomonas trivialis]KRP58875.1 hypothetical protein TU79_17620 [Pseudomonas trivialis]SDT18042.1 hypothetical protein SAMN04490205_5076 [Pseudomonas trivialis]
MIRFLAMGVSLCAMGSALAGPVELHSGRYEGLMLAVTPQHEIEGYYAEQMGEGMTRGCAFYLQGKPDALTTWLDAAYPGSVASSVDGVTLTVEQGRQHPGCMNVLMPEIATGLDLSETAETNWIGLVTVATDKAYLLESPGAKAAKRPYIVKHDVVGVLAFKDGWAQVEFTTARDRTYTGWISQDQYARLTPPKS